MRYKRTCNHCDWAWVAVERQSERCPRCSSPSYRSRPAPFFQGQPLETPRPNRPLRAAGWYADPSERYSARFWDGEVWTQRVFQGGAEAVDLNPLGLVDVWNHPERRIVATR